MQINIWMYKVLLRNLPLPFNLQGRNCVMCINIHKKAWNKVNDWVWLINWWTSPSWTNSTEKLSLNQWIRDYILCIRWINKINYLVIVKRVIRLLSDWLIIIYFQIVHGFYDEPLNKYWSSPMLTYVFICYILSNWTICLRNRNQYATVFSFEVLTQTEQNRRTCIHCPHRISFSSCEIKITKWTCATQIHFEQ